MTKAMPQTLAMYSHLRGAVSIEFSLMVLFGLVPLLILTFTSTLIFAARQSMTQATLEGARASLQYGTNGSMEQRLQNACQAAQHSMPWLFNFAKQPLSNGCTSSEATVAVIARQVPCSSADDTQVSCVQVMATYHYSDAPFFPGTKSIYGWVMGPLSTSATVQINQG
jgi:Flp pilus assembly protein TadG